MFVCFSTCQGTNYLGTKASKHGSAWRMCETWLNSKLLVFNNSPLLTSNECWRWRCKTCLSSRTGSLNSGGAAGQQQRLGLLTSRRNELLTSNCQKLLLISNNKPQHMCWPATRNARDLSRQAGSLLPRCCCSATSKTSCWPARGWPDVAVQQLRKHLADQQEGDQMLLFSNFVNILLTSKKVAAKQPVLTAGHARDP